MEMNLTTPRSILRRFAPGLAMLGALLVQLPAQAQGIYLCTDAEGRRVLTDSYKNGCKTLDISNNVGTPIPAPRKGGARAPSPPPTTPAAFPKVNDAEQKARDSDRRGILEEELRTEKKKLAEMKKEFNNGEPERQGNERNYAKYQERVEQMKDSINRAEKNIEALEREIANIK
ncbi:hypothetical protein SAMN05428948_3367 [Massilia sp. CF038]|nr:hypothetical protein SAMN05428948_3367 [Massilia sp. CF038]